MLVKRTQNFVVFVASTWLIAGAGAVSAYANPIENELRYLLDSHPKIRGAEKTVESRRASIREATALHLPTVTATGEVGPQIVDSPSQRASDPQAKAWGGVKSIAGLNITQNVFDGFRIISQVRSAKINREIASISLEGTRQSTLFEGVVAYINVLRQRRLMIMGRENEHTILRQLNLEDERVRRGSGVNVDVLQAKSRLQIAKERRVGFEGALANAITTYEQVFSHAPELSTMIDPAPPPETIPSSLERAIDISLLENPALLSGATSMELAKEKRTETLSSLYPTVDFVGTANYEHKNNAVVGTRRDYSLSLAANWKLYNGGSTMAQAERNTFEYRAAMDNYDFLTAKIIQQTTVAWQTLVTSRERRGLLGNAVNIASEVFDNRKKLRDAGKETVINVLDAENEVNNAQINYTTASYDTRVAVYQLLLAMGRLKPVYMISKR